MVSVAENEMLQNFHKIVKSDIEKKKKASRKMVVDRIH